MSLSPSKPWRRDVFPALVATKRQTLVCPGGVTPELPPFILVLVKKGSWCAHERVGFQFHLPGPRRGRTYCHFPVTNLDPKTAWRFSWEKRRLPFLETRHESWYFPASAYLSCAMIQDQLTQPENGHLIVPTLLPPVPLVMMPTLVLTAMFQTMVPATTQQQPRWRPQHITQHGMSQQFPGT